MIVPGLVMLNFCGDYYMLLKLMDYDDNSWIGDVEFLW